MTELKKVLDSYNEFYEMIKNFEEVENFDKLFIPSVDNYIKVKKMMITDNDNKTIDEIKELENNDYLQSLSKKSRKIYKKQIKMKMMNDCVKHN